MRVYKTRAFQRWLSKQVLTDEMLFEAVSEIEQGLVDANLGGFLYKKRIALPGRGKRGSVRTLLAVKHGSKAIYLYGFEKNQRDNLTVNEEKAYKLIAKTVLGYTDGELQERLNEQSLIEIVHKPEI
jgi:hypothetical protein